MAWLPYSINLLGYPTLYTCLLRVTQLGLQTESLSVAAPDGFQVPRWNALVLVKGCQLYPRCGQLPKAWGSQSLSLVTAQDPVKLSVAVKGTFFLCCFRAWLGTP